MVPLGKCIYFNLQEITGGHLIGQGIMSSVFIGKTACRTGDTGKFGQDMTLDARAMLAFPMWQCFQGRQNVMQLNLLSRCRIAQTFAFI